MDSFETLSLAMDLVELYDLHIPVEAVERFERVSDFIQYLHSALIHFLQVAAWSCCAIRVFARLTSRSAIIHQLGA